jgi:ABC-2 type transport system ATP-binding protein
MRNQNLILKNVTKKYNKKVLANDAVSLVFEPRTITALIGHNGAGKSTLLNQIVGLVKPTEGKISVKGLDPIKERAKVIKVVSSMPQFQAPLNGVSVKQAIKNIAMIKGFSRREAEKRTQELLDLLQIQKWQDKSGDDLSGGLQRLTSFAMSVVDAASVIILDEPTNDVDPVRRILMWKYLRQLADSGSIIIIITHNLLEVEKYSDRYVLLDKGRVLKDVNVKNQYNPASRHHLAVYGIEEADVSHFTSRFKTIYKQDEATLRVFLAADELAQALSIVLAVLNAEKAVNYELKIESLLDNYEGMVGA